MDDRVWSTVGAVSVKDFVQFWTYLAVGARSKRNCQIQKFLL